VGKTKSLNWLTALWWDGAQTESAKNIVPLDTREKEFYWVIKKQCYRDWAKGKLIFNGCRVFVLQDEKSSANSLQGWLHKTHLMPQNCVLKNGQDGKFCYVHFTTTLKLENTSCYKVCSPELVAYETDTHYNTYDLQGRWGKRGWFEGKMQTL
jgi:hypothetical protein